MKTIIGVIGASEATPGERETALEVGRRIAGKGAVLLSGGSGGVMEAACMGAKSEGGITVGIIPGASKSEANGYVDIPVVTGMGHGRNIIVASSCDAIIAIGGGFGTLSEIAFALRLKIPVVGIGTWDVSSEIKKAAGPGEAVDMAIELAGLIADSGLR